MAPVLQLPIQLTAPPPVLAPRASCLSNEYLLHNSSSKGSKALVRVRPKSRRQSHGVCTGTTPASRRPPPPFVQCQRRLCRRLYPTCVHGPRTRTAQICLCKPLHAPVVPGSVHVIWYIDDWGAYIPVPSENANTNGHVYFHPPSVAALSHFHPGCCNSVL